MIYPFVDASSFLFLFIVSVDLPIEYFMFKIYLSKYLYFILLNPYLNAKKSWSSFKVQGNNHSPGHMLTN